MEESDGRIAVEIYPAMQLGGAPPSLYDQVRDGVVDVVWTLPGYTPGRFPLTEVFELPFMAGSAEATSQAAQAFYEENLTDEFSDVHVLMLHTHAPGTFHLREEQFESLDDLEGRSIRAPTRVINDALDALGAVPVGMPVPQVPEALSRGVIDGTVIPWEVARPLRVHELVCCHTEIDADRGFYTSVFLFAMNKDVYDGLPDDLRAIIDNNSGMALAQEIGRVWDEAEAPGHQSAVDAGNQFVVLSDDVVAEMGDRTQPVIDAWVTNTTEAGNDGAALLDRALELVDQYSQ
jgi:TRAP-type C4-dicarboxylate transport system substrate-binding protein